MAYTLVIAGADPEVSPGVDAHNLDQSLDQALGQIAAGYGAQVGQMEGVHLPTGAHAARWTVSDLDPASVAQFRTAVADHIPHGPTDVAIALADLFAASGGMPKLLVADMESTIIAQECLDELAGDIGARPAVSAITARAMAGELAFEEALSERVNLLTGLPVAQLEKLAARLTFNPGALAFVQTLRAAGAYCALVSGGFTFFTEQIALAAGFHHHRANTLEIAGDTLTGKVVPPILGVDAKADAVLALTAELGISPNEVLTIGDGANDAAMTRLVAHDHSGLGVGYRPKPVLRGIAGVSFDHADMSAVLALCPGYQPAA